MSNKSKKRRRRRKVGATASKARPRFAKGFPSNAELDRLVDAFSAGNFALVRREAPALADKAEDEAVRDAARELRRRISPEPTAVYLWALGVALVLMLYGYYVMNQP